jgi:Putative polyhydroxyalkanoic acid system protein (PHA_gran_rgn)
VKHQIPHTLTVEQSRKAARRAFKHYKAEFKENAPTIQWNDNGTASVQFKVMGVDLSGVATFENRLLTLELTVPVYLMAFKSVAIGVIDSQARGWISKA